MNDIAALGCCESDLIATDLIQLSFELFSILKRKARGARLERATENGNEKDKSTVY